MQGHLDMFVPSQENNLRLLGLPISLQRGKVMLEQSFTVCNKGDVLTPERAKIIEYLGMSMAEFCIELLAYYSKGKGLQELRNV